MEKKDKTNALRLLEKEKIVIEVIQYDSEITDGKKIAEILGENADVVFKTLVTISNTKEHFVFCIPVSQTLNLKKAAKAAGVKSIEMIPQKELLPLTGYIHGGCSPVGMKTKFKTFIDETVILWDQIYLSAGRVGMQMKINVEDIINYVQMETVDLIN